MTDWKYAQSDPSDELAQLHYFSMKKRQPAGDLEFVITVREYVDRNTQGMRFFAQADKPVNQGTAPYLPFGWGETLLGALTECMRVIRQPDRDE
jgi:hypothetical protein